MTTICALRSPCISANECLFPSKEEVAVPKSEEPFAFARKEFERCGSISARRQCKAQRRTEMKEPSRPIPERGGSCGGQRCSHALNTQDAGADVENAPSLSRRQNGLSGASTRGAQELANALSIRC
jgi:hypothetical protein